MDDISEPILDGNLVSTDGSYVALPSDVSEGIISMAQEFGYRSSAESSRKGESGVTHKFAYLFESGDRLLVVDVYRSVDEIEVLATFIKVMDTASSCCIVATGYITDGARELAGYYGMQLFLASDFAKKEGRPNPFTGQSS